MVPKGVEARDDPHVVAGLQVAMDDLTSLTGGCRASVLRLHSDKAKEFLAKSVRSLLSTWDSSDHQFRI